MIKRIEKRKYIAEAPFRLDLVMGGVSDLSWWNDRDGDCLSISCRLKGHSITINAKIRPVQIKP